MATPLPKFDNPPVVEVALSILFEPLVKLRTAHTGRLWARLEPEGFTTTEDQPELPPVMEEPSAPAAPPRLEFLDRPRLRVWFQNLDGTQLLQVQHNRIAYNWKKGSTSEPYPSYDVVEKRFRELLPIFVAFVAEERLGEIVPTQAEATYVNHIREPHASIGQVFTFWAGATGSFLRPLEDITLRARYPIGDGGTLLGRLSVELQPAYLVSDRTEILNLNMIARGKPLRNDLEGALEFLAIGHESIVRAFVEITTSDMQRKWGRTQ